MIRQKTFGQAIWQIVIADVSMSLDNVLAVAGAAREHPMILVFGLALSIALMGLAATFIAKLLERTAGSPMSGSPSFSMWRWRCATAAVSKSGPTRGLRCCAAKAAPSG